MATSHDNEQVEMMTAALQHSNELVTQVIRGDNKAMRTALNHARLLDELERKFGTASKTPSVPR